MRKDWYLGFFGFFGIQGIVPLLKGDYWDGLWVIWFVWFLYFIPIKKKSNEADLYKKVEDFVRKSFNNDKDSMRHFERTVYWLKQLKPDADEAFVIAALSHDIERGQRSKETFDKIKKSSAGFTDKEFLDYHQNTSAESMFKFLKENGASAEMAERVKMLISKHEVGGNEDQNILKDADSLSFLENNIGFFIEKKLPVVGKDKVREKFDWMYNRISSEKAKEIGKNWYEEGIKKINN